MLPRSVISLFLAGILAVGTATAQDPGADLPDLGDIDLEGGARDIGPGEDLNNLQGTGGIPEEPLPAELPPSSPQALRGNRELREYPLIELIEATLANNLEIQAQSQAINAAHYDWKNARAQDLPTATFTTAFQHSNQDDRLKPLAGLKIDRLFGSIFDTNSLIAGLTIKVPVYEGDRLDILPHLASSKEKIEIIRREILKQDLQIQVVENYVDLLLARKELALSGVKLRQKEAELKKIQDQVTNDVALSQGILGVELAIDDIRQESLEQSNLLLLLREKLAKLAGLPRGLEFRLTEKLPMRNLTLPLEEILPVAIAENPRILLLDEAAVLSDKQVTQADAANDPALDLLLDYKEHAFFKDSDFNADVYTAFLQFSYDLYEGGRNQTNERRTIMLREKARLEQQNGRQDLETLVRQTHNKYVEAIKLVERADRSILLARENLRLVRDKFQANLVLQADLLEAQVNLDRALVFRDRVITGIIKSRAQLFRLMGRLSPAIFR